MAEIFQRNCQTAEYKSELFNINMKLFMANNNVHVLHTKQREKKLLINFNVSIVKPSHVENYATDKRNNNVLAADHK